MNLFVFGLGYSASQFVRDRRAAFDRVVGTVRMPDANQAWTGQDVSVLRFDGSDSDPHLAAMIAETDVLLVSVQPGREPDPVLARFDAVIRTAKRLHTIVYLSTIGVYGDHGGAWIDERAPTHPDNERQSARIVAENSWTRLGIATAKAVRVLRLAGIYGPGRNALQDLRDGEARRIDKPGQVFNRIHVADIGRAIAAAMHYEGPHTVVNVTDDEPAPAPEVVAYAAGLIGREPPGLVPFETAMLSPMARSFYGANRRVANTLLKRDFGVALAYPTYREGLDALWRSGEGR